MLMPSRQQHDLARHLRRRCPDFLAPHPITARHFLGEGLDGCGVEPCIRFRDAEAALILARHKRRNPALLLFVRTEHHDGMWSEQIDVHRRGGRHAAAVARHLVHHDHSLSHAKTRSAIGLGHGEPQPAALGHGAMKLHGEMPVLVALQPVGIAEARSHCRHPLADGFVIVISRKIHGVTRGGSRSRFAEHQRLAQALAH
jgi:hypothetical protein